MSKMRKLLLVIGIVMILTISVSAQTQLGPADGKPVGVVDFGETSPLSSDDVDPESLSGKIRVSDEEVDNMSVELHRNTSDEFQLEFENDNENAENVTVYMQVTAMQASQNISNLSAQLDGEPLQFGESKERGNTWISFVIGHFSTRTVVFKEPSGSVSIGGTDIPVGVVLIVIGLALAGAWAVVVVSRKTEKLYIQA